MAKSKGEDGGGGFLEAIKLSWAYTAADVRRRPRNMVIGIVATVLLVFFSGVVLVGIWKAPYVLLRLAELTVGEMDVILYGNGSQLLLNYTAMNRSMYASAVVAGSAPRWVARADLTSQASFRKAQADPAYANSSAYKSTAANILLIDSALEKTAGIGRGWTYREIGYDEAQIFYSAADYIGVSENKGQRVHLSMDAATVQSILGPNTLAYNITRPRFATDPLSLYIIAFFELNNITGDSISIMEFISFAMEATMADAVKSTEGKYSSVLGNIVIMDSREFLNVIMAQSGLVGSQTLTANTNYYFPTISDLLNISALPMGNINLNDYAMMVVVMLEGRYDMYYSDTEPRGRRLTEKSNELMQAVGLDFAGSLQFPVETTIETFDMFRILMTATFITVVVGIVVLGCILMFTLLQINAEERQFEMAMIRAQGMPRRQIVAILFMQTLVFTLPGTAAGVSLICAANALIERLLANFTKAPARPGHVPIVAVVISMAMGLVLPLVATYGPVKAALGSSLRDALDIYRQSYNEAHVKAIRLEEMGLRMWQILLGLFLVVAGFTVYYLMPLSFIFSNMMMFFVLLDLVLICMIAGLCMMMYVLQPPAEIIVLYLLLWGKETRLWRLIRKNLRSHRDRNAKAYMMFLLSVACLVSSGMMFGMLSNISAQLAELTTGAPVTITSSSFSNPLAQDELDAFLRDEGSTYVTNWAYSSFPLNQYPQVSGTTQVGNLIGSYRGIGVRAVTENFMEATYPDFNMVQSYRNEYSYPSNAYHQRDVVRSMYVDPPNRTVQESEQMIVTGFSSGAPVPNVTGKETYVIPMLISSAARDQIGLEVTAAAQLRYSYRLNDTASVQSTIFYLEPRALMNRISGFIAVSSLPVLFSSGTILIPTSYFQQLLDPVHFDYDADSDTIITDKAVKEVRQATLYVQLRKGVTTRQRERFVNALQAHTNTLYHTTVDTVTTVEHLKSVQNLILYFFYFTAVICIILCAFMMWVTFISNVQLNAWTFGVLRSLGFRTAQLMRSAVYEALCIVVSAFVFGLGVGIIVGVTMAVELCRLMVIPFHFSFPYVLVLIVVGLALLAAVMGSILPFLSLRKKPISFVLRGV
ncbi:permease-like protein [Leptomonas pyrrhocoris]|uniref:Permease-like protein n=1 Tax=Leptomonas pyrrhocoris TaxID=157538 RepID=A0A0N0DYF5_LEPPY|nr:permease-like protein [Leptomonas pyrrhocoris]KPA84075.1 permease-like protein [Leptomonas pyrrhocoris]|eukprot:XP_015662514.1 permease-like protein [Leptomonas pyrrhocoris]